MSLRCPRGSLCVVLPDPMAPGADGSSAAIHIRALLQVLSGTGTGRETGTGDHCEGGSLELLGRPARDWLPTDLDREVTYLGDREEMLELPAGKWKVVARP